MSERSFTVVIRSPAVEVLEDAMRRRDMQIEDGIVFTVENTILEISKAEDRAKGATQTGHVVVFENKG